MFVCVCVSGVVCVLKVIHMIQLCMWLSESKAWISCIVLCSLINVKPCWIDGYYWLHRSTSLACLHSLNQPSRLPWPKITPLMLEDAREVPMRAMCMPGCFSTTGKLEELQSFASQITTNHDRTMLTTTMNNIWQCTNHNVAALCNSTTQYICNIYICTCT